MIMSLATIFYRGKTMNSDQWFAVKRNKDTSVVYLMVGGDRCMVTATAKMMFHDPIIQKITWGIMRQLTGCHIPGDKLPTDFCRGEILLPRRGKYDLVIKAL